jgi:hypothetical protein
MKKELESMKSKNLRMFFLIISFVGMVVFIRPNAYATVYGGIDFPQGAVSFADSVFNYQPGPGTSVLNSDPSRALGVPDGNVTELGQGGTLILQFSDNSLTTSGSSLIDLWVFELGSLEPQYVSISTNGQNWINVGATDGGTSGVDIDSYIGNGIVSGEKYSYVKLVDKNGLGSGADIDAVGAFNPSTPVAPEPVSSVLFVTGGVMMGVRGWARRKRQIS